MLLQTHPPQGQENHLLQEDEHLVQERLGPGRLDSADVDKGEEEDEAHHSTVEDVVQLVAQSPPPVMGKEGACAGGVGETLQLWEKTCVTLIG